MRGRELAEQRGDGMRMRSTFPLFPTDDGWPYPDADADDRLVCHGYMVDEDVDLDALQLVANTHAFDGLSLAERDALDRRFWQGESMKELARSLGCSSAEAAAVLGQAVDKVRKRLAPDS
jgi:DNA-directed RNA polymerase specialized sigma24 family protein